MTAAAISFRRISKAYGTCRALEEISLDVHEREFLAIVGPSGSGKTTLLRFVNRLADPDSGTIHVRGEDVQRIDPVTLRRQIGYVFQGVGLFPHMTVADNISITPRLLGWDRDRIAARVNALLDLVRLDKADHRDRMPAQLSGGQSQRVGVARALAAEPALVLMDEPFGALDPLTRNALAEDYRKLHDTLGLTTVMITHDILEAVVRANRIAVMRAGRIVATGTAAELLECDDEYVRDLIGTPQRQIEALRAALKIS